jgi:hypothetical protein
MGNAALTVGSYHPLYKAIAALAMLSLAGLACLHAIRKREHLEAREGMANSPQPMANRKS